MDGCHFIDCQFSETIAAKFYCWYCKFIRCDFDSGFIDQVDFHYTFFYDSQFFDLKVLYVYFYDCDFRECSYCTTTKNENNSWTTAIFNCKIWHSNQWIDIPDCSEFQEDNLFFQLQETIEEEDEEE